VLIMPGPPGFKGGAAAKGGAASMTCGGCGRPIGAADRVVKHDALSARYHAECYVCKQCSKPLDGKASVVHNDAPYCEADYESLVRTKCCVCQGSISGVGNALEIAQDDGPPLQLHSTCFRCQTCNKTLKGGPFYVKNSKVYCEPHAQ